MKRSDENPHPNGARGTHSRVVHVRVRGRDINTAAIIESIRHRVAGFIVHSCINHNPR
jgi:hypothetical protein